MKPDLQFEPIVEHHGGNCVRRFGASRYAQSRRVGAHVLEADEPADVGGNDTGPNSLELLMAALGACASITAQMYAERKQWKSSERPHRRQLRASRCRGQCRVWGEDWNGGPTRNADFFVLGSIRGATK